MTRRTVYVTPQNQEGAPGRIVIDVYEDEYSPLDIMHGILIWLHEDHVAMEAFRTYVDTNSEGEEPLSLENVARNLALLHGMMTVMRTNPHHVVWVTGEEGWRN